AYENLRFLCKNIGARLSGSDASYKAVYWGEHLMRSYQFDNVFLQEVKVPVWKRGFGERLFIEDIGIVPVLALGGSVATKDTLKAEIVEVRSFAEAESLDPALVKDKILFFNEAMDQRFVNTFRAYGACAQQRYAGARVAGQLGARAALVRSLAISTDRYPHTGSMGYEEGIPKVPGAAIGTEYAYKLSQLLDKGPVSGELKLNCSSLPDTTSFNVIAEIKGTEHPEKFILVGGHLDSWDVGEGAHDDGAGVIQALEAIRLFKQLGIKPRHTIRCVWYMNEENGNMGGKTYAKVAKEKGWEHLAAIESDRGGFSPRGFDYDGDNQFQLEHFQSWKKLLEPYGLHQFQRGYSGVDIRPLRDNKIALFGLSPDSQRYFKLHHSAADVFEEVDKRELELGAAAMASLVYLIDKYGFPTPITSD
ncbi:MAG: M20/M25/M40 family metallo-hydrolase, partial [Flavobacteriales bacterium]|nr:M20/M25/M40 family metallo-hydrolase [Flavobacteriales bacterium]